MECVNLAVIEVSVALSANVESGKCGFMTATFRPVDDLVLSFSVTFVAMSKLLFFDSDGDVVDAFFGAWLA